MKKKITFEGSAISGISYTVLTIFALFALLPFMNAIAKSFSADWAIQTGSVGLLPKGFNLDSYKRVLNSSMFLNSFFISGLITLIGTTFALFMTGLAAYPLSKRWLPGNKIILLLYVITMLFSGGLIPNYLLIKQLGLYNSIWAVILPTMINVFNMLIIKNFYESIPESLEEAAKLDGASNIYILFKIIIPLSLPVFATICLFSVVGYWNEYFLSMIYINSPNLKPLQLYLRDIMADEMDLEMQSTVGMDNVTSEGVRMASIIASTVPILLVYLFLQKYFIKGIMIGSVKG